MELLNKIKNSFFKHKNNTMPVSLENEDYMVWISNQEPNPDMLKAQKNTKFKYNPKISIICPSYKANEHYFLELLKSIDEQTYQNWELCVSDVESKDDFKDLLRKSANENSKIKIKLLDIDLGLTANTIEAIRLSQGDIICFIDQCDIIAPFALYDIVKAANENPKADFFYSDEDKFDAISRYSPHFKPDYSPDTLKSYNYIGHIMALKRDLYERSGGLKEGYDVNQYHDLALRATFFSKKIVHIPKVLYHWRARANKVTDKANEKYAFESGRRAVLDFVKTIKVEDSQAIDVNTGIIDASYRVRYKLKEDALISIIIPGGNNPDILKKCIDSIEKTANCNYEIIILENNSSSKEIQEYYKELAYNKKARIIAFNGKYSYSRANNIAAKSAKGNFLLFLGHDITAIIPGWIQAMLEHAGRKDVGAVGAKLLYDNNTIEHCGIVIGLDGWADHICLGIEENGEGILNSNYLINTVRNVSAVTGACMMIEKYKFDNVGGFDEGFILCGADIELCLRLLKYDYVNIYTPFARLYNHESLTKRNKKIPSIDYELSFEAYNQILKHGDQYYNINFDYQTNIPSVAHKVIMPIEFNSFYNKSKKKIQKK